MEENRISFADTLREILPMWLAAVLTTIVGVLVARVLGASEPLRLAIAVVTLVSVMALCFRKSWLLPRHPST